MCEKTMNAQQIESLNKADTKLFFDNWKDSDGLHITRYNGAFYLMRGEESVDGNRYTANGVLKALKKIL